MKQKVNLKRKNFKCKLLSLLFAVKNGTVCTVNFRFLVFLTSRANEKKDKKEEEHKGKKQKGNNDWLSQKSLFLISICKSFESKKTTVSFLQVGKLSSCRML